MLLLNHFSSDSHLYTTGLYVCYLILIYFSQFFIVSVFWWCVITFSTFCYWKAMNIQTLMMCSWWENQLTATHSLWVASTNDTLLTRCKTLSALDDYKKIGMNAMFGIVSTYIMGKQLQLIGIQEFGILLLTSPFAPLNLAVLCLYFHVYCTIKKFLE